MSTEKNTKAKETKTKEVKLLEINASRKTLLSISAGFALMDGIGHIANGLGYVLSLGNLNQLVTATEAFSWAQIAWGGFMLGIGLLILFLIYK
ncbi:MAG: hypothetical protein PHY47_00620 [Lachnospiraceae bacterium]|nr:hypothetical protein [Lachnospiraceae bacterium]